MNELNYLTEANEMAQVWLTASGFFQKSPTKNPIGISEIVSTVPPPFRSFMVICAIGDNAGSGTESVRQ